MKDQLFEGKDVNAALATAKSALGVTSAELRYVVLAKGTEPGAGTAGTPARIAVLLDAMVAPPGQRRQYQERAPDPGDTQGGRPTEGAEPIADEALLGVRRILAALAEDAGQELRAELSEERDGFRLQLSGAGCSLLLEDGGHALLALDHLLNRSLARGPATPRLRLSCEGFREGRDLWLTERARELAADVRRDHSPRETEPMNAYDRRIVHMAVAGEPGVRSVGIGEGPERRVMVALAEPAAGGGPELQ